MLIALCLIQLARSMIVSICLYVCLLMFSFVLRVLKNNGVLSRYSFRVKNNVQNHRFVSSNSEIIQAAINTYYCIVLVGFFRIYSFLHPENIRNTCCSIIQICLQKCEVSQRQQQLDKAYKTCGMQYYSYKLLL